MTRQVDPVFSIVTAAYNRGRHIVPTIRSVLAQSFNSFELIVVGDGCTDDTESCVRQFPQDRVRWHNLPERSGSQSAPNNAGIALARGRYIAYLGHDDIWAPDHLQALHDCFQANPAAGFAVSGCLFYGPPGSGFYVVTGLFEDEAAKFEHFFPPSSFAHEKRAIESVGPWRPPHSIRPPADVEFVLRAAESGQRFVSTGRITAHKFTAGHRYLSYLRPESWEQQQLLAMMAEPTFPTFVSAATARAREIGRFMAPKHRDFSTVSPGELFNLSRTRKGIFRPSLAPLLSEATIEPSDDPRVLDWTTAPKGKCVVERRSGRNPRPRILIPFAARSPVELRFALRGLPDDGVLDRLRVKINDVAVPWHRRGSGAPGQPPAIVCVSKLRPDDCSIVEFDLTGGTDPGTLMRRVERPPGQIAIAAIALRRLGLVQRIRRVLRGNPA